MGDSGGTAAVRVTRVPVGRWADHLVHGRPRKGRSSRRPGDRPLTWASVLSP